MKRSLVVLLALPFVVATQTTPTQAAGGGGAILRTECLPIDPGRQEELARQRAEREAEEARRRAEAARRAEEARRAAEAARKAEEARRAADAARRAADAERRAAEAARRDAEAAPTPATETPSVEDQRRAAEEARRAAEEARWAAERQIAEEKAARMEQAMDALGYGDGATVSPMPMDEPDPTPSFRPGRDDDERRVAEQQARMVAEHARVEAERYWRAEEASRAASEAPAPPALDASVALEDPPQRRPTPVPISDGQDAAWDWGASLFLSNDDSMSLASAQRVLYALKHGVGLDPGDVRPHELLNYFSFDTVEPGTGDVFSLTAAAEAQGDTLSMAMAVKGAEPERRPLDLTAVVDVSGSMGSDGRLDTVKRALHLVEEQLEEGDRFDLVTFSTHQCVALEDFVVGRDDPSLLQRAIDGMAPTHSTDLHVGLQAGYELAEARTTPGRNQRVMLMTDANLNVGLTDHGIVADVARAYEDHGIRLTGVGVGRDFNDALLDKVTERGKGAYVYLGSDAVVDRLFGVGFPALVETVAHDVQFELTLPDSLAMERFYGEEISTMAADVQPIHYYAGTSQVFLQDLHMGEVADGDRVRLAVRYTDAVTGEKASQAFETTVGALLDADRRNVHKAQALMAFSDVVMDRAMGADPCEAVATYSQRARKLRDDDEIGYVNGLLEGMCPELEAPVAYKLSFQTDRPLDQASLHCGGEAQGHALSASDTVVRFDAQPGTCWLRVSDGSAEWTASVSVPEAGGAGRCVVRGRQLSCR